MVANPLTTALIGCGQIADAHLQELSRIPTASVAAVCDVHMDLARQAAARFGVPRVFDNVERMLAETRPDVVHITTPPHTHRPLALGCLDAGAHVYVEKPFTVDIAQAEEVMHAAETRRLRVCLGHDQLFDPAWQECRSRVAAGEVGEIAPCRRAAGLRPRRPLRAGAPRRQVALGAPAAWRAVSERDVARARPDPRLDSG